MVGVFASESPGSFIIFTEWCIEDDDNQWFLLNACCVHKTHQRKHKMGEEWKIIALPRRWIVCARMNRNLKWILLCAMGYLSKNKQLYVLLGRRHRLEGRERERKMRPCSIRVCVRACEWDVFFEGRKILKRSIQIQSKRKTVFSLSHFIYIVFIKSCIIDKPIWADLCVCVCACVPLRLRGIVLTYNRITLW